MNAQAVSRFLGKTYKRSLTVRTKIRGWTNTTAGVIVSQSGCNVLVSFTNGSKYGTSDSIFKDINNQETDLDNSLRSYLSKAGFKLADRADYILVIGKTEKANA